MNTQPQPRRLIAVCDGNYDLRHGGSNAEKLSRCIATYADNGCEQLVRHCLISSPPAFISYISDNVFINCIASAYAFIAFNFKPGDEIFLFGFSAGAHVARMVAHLIGKIGILDADESLDVGRIIEKYEQLKISRDPEEKERLQKELEPYLRRDSPGNKRLASSGCTFSIQCLGLFDSVGSSGIEDDDNLVSKEDRESSAFDKTLGVHIQRAFHALALDETRPDFNCNLLEQTEEGRAKGQILRQCWFAGNHSDVGGTYSDHDLGDLALIWMIANIQSFLTIDLPYMEYFIKPTAPWGKQKPHHCGSGIQRALHSKRRTFPTMPPNNVTNERIHSSVWSQENLDPKLKNALSLYADSLIEPRLPLEQKMRDKWAAMLARSRSEKPFIAKIGSFVRTSPRRLSLPWRN